MARYVISVFAALLTAVPNVSTADPVDVSADDTYSDELNPRTRIFLPSVGVKSSVNPTPPITPVVTFRCFINVSGGYAVVAGYEFFAIV
jgi:hypothetical protein